MVGWFWCHSWLYKGMNIDLHRLLYTVLMSILSRQTEAIHACIGVVMCDNVTILPRMARHWSVFLCILSCCALCVAMLPGSLSMFYLPCPSWFSDSCQSQFWILLPAHLISSSAAVLQLCPVEHSLLDYSCLLFWIVGFSDFWTVWSVSVSECQWVSVSVSAQFLFSGYCLFQALRTPSFLFLVLD